MLVDPDCRFEILGIYMGTTLREIGMPESGDAIFTIVTERDRHLYREPWPQPVAGCRVQSIPSFDQKSLPGPYEDIRVIRVGKPASKIRLVDENLTLRAHQTIRYQ